MHNYYLEPGGEDAVEHAERRLCIDAGCDVVLYTRDNREIDDYSLWRTASLAPRAIWAWDTRRELAALIERERPDVAHFTNPFPLISPAAYATCRKAGVAVVQSLQNYRLLCPAATFFRDGNHCTECTDHSLVRSVRHRCYRGSLAATATVASTLAIHRRLGTFREQVDAYVALTEFARNRFSGDGAGLANFSSHPTLTDCTFEDNEATGSGGAMYNGEWPNTGGGSNPTLTNCTFSVSAHLNHTGGRTGGVVIAWLVAMSSAEWLGCAGVRRGGIACDRRGHGVR